MYALQAAGVLSINVVISIEQERCGLNCNAMNVELMRRWLLKKPTMSKIKFYLMNNAVYNNRQKLSSHNCCPLFE